MKIDNKKTLLNLLNIKNNEIYLNEDLKNYTTFKLEWWHMFATGVLICLVVIFVPLLSKKDRKMLEKVAKTSKKSKR